MMKKYIIERDLSGSNSMNEEDLRRFVVQANRSLRRIAPSARWIQSFFSREKSFCVVMMSETAIADFLSLADCANTEVREITSTIDDSQAGGLRAVWTAMDSWAED
jgi:hypothetical protein